jgi:hypothetical protein
MSLLGPGARSDLTGWNDVANISCQLSNTKGESFHYLLIKVLDGKIGLPAGRFGGQVILFWHDCPGGGNNYLLKRIPR